MEMLLRRGRGCRMQIGAISEKHSKKEWKDYGVCLPLVKGGQKRAGEEGGGGVSFSVSLKREWGKGGREIM